MVSPTVKLNTANRLNRMSSHSAGVVPSHTFVPIESLTASPTSSTGSASVLEWNSNSDSELFQLSSPATLTASPSPQNSGAAMHFSLPSLVIEEDERHPKARDEVFLVQWEDESFNTVQPPALSPPTPNLGDVTNGSITTTDTVDDLETPQNEDPVDKLCDDMVQWFIKSESSEDHNRRIASLFAGQGPFISNAPSQDTPAVASESAPQPVVFDMALNYLTTPIAAVGPHPPQIQSPLVSCSLFQAPISSPSSPQSIPVVRSPKISPPSPPPVVIVSNSSPSTSPPSPAPYLDKGKAPAVQRNKMSIAEYFKRKAAEKEAAASSPRKVLAPVPVPMSVSLSAVTPVIYRPESVNSDLSYCTEPRARSPPVPVKVPETKDNTKKPPVIRIASSPLDTSRYLTPEPFCPPSSRIPPSHEFNTLQPPLIWVAPPDSEQTLSASYQRSPNDLLNHPTLYRSPIVPSRSSDTQAWYRDPTLSKLPVPSWPIMRRETEGNWHSPSSPVGMGANMTPRVAFVPPTVSPPSTRTNSPSVNIARVPRHSYAAPRDVPSYNSSMSGQEGGRTSVENSFINRPLSLSSRSEVDSSRSPSPPTILPFVPPVPTWASRVSYPYAPANGGVETPQTASWLNYVKMQSNKSVDVNPSNLRTFNFSNLDGPSDSSASIPAWLKNTSTWQPPTSTPRVKTPLPSTHKSDATPQFALQSDVNNVNAGNAQESYAEAFPSTWSQWGNPKNVHTHATYDSVLNAGTYSGPMPARPSVISHGRVTSAYPTHNSVPTPWTGSRIPLGLPPISSYTYGYQGSPFVPVENTSSGPFPGPALATDPCSHGQYTGSTLPRDRKLQAPAPFSPWACQIDPPQRRLRFAPTPTAPSSYKPTPVATTPLHPIPPHTFMPASQSYGGTTYVPQCHSPPSPPWSPLPQTQPSAYNGSGATASVTNSNFGYRSHKQFSFVDATVIFRVSRFLYRI